MPCKEVPLHCLWKAERQRCCQEKILTSHDGTTSPGEGCVVSRSQIRSDTSFILLRCRHSISNSNMYFANEIIEAKKNN